MAASTVLVPEIGVIRRCLLSFPRNRRSTFAQYICERPELSPNDFGVNEGSNNKGKYV
jgi:hypothetical protein